MGNILESIRELSELDVQGGLDSIHDSILDITGAVNDGVMENLDATDHKTFQLTEDLVPRWFGDFDAAYSDLSLLQIYLFALATVSSRTTFRVNGVATNYASP